MTDLPTTEAAGSEKPETGGHMVPGARLKKEIAARKAVEQKLVEALAENAKLIETHSETEANLQLARSMCDSWERRLRAKERELEKFTMPLASLGNLPSVPDVGSAAVIAPGFQSLAQLGKSAGYIK